MIHPDTVEDFKMLEATGLPFLIENMDKRKTRGILAAEFTAYSMLYNFGYVLDLKHVYEHDPTMALAGDYVSAMSGRLREIHISGDGENSNHVTLYNMDAGEKIASLIPAGVPVIIESVFEEPNEFIVRRELDFVRRHSL